MPSLFHEIKNGGPFGDRHFFSLLNNVKLYLCDRDNKDPPLFNCLFHYLKLSRRLQPNFV